MNSQAWLVELEALFLKGAERVSPGRVGVIWSGGVDSTLVAWAASRFSDVTAYTVGVEGSDDLKHTRLAEKEAPFKTREILLSLDDVEALVPKILSAWPKPNPIDVGVGIPMYAASAAAKADGVDVLLCGQGGDELFGGYWRYLECMVSDGPQAVAAWMEKDWANAYVDNLDRDVALNRANGCELRFPYVDHAFSGYVRSMPLGLKIREDGDLPCDEVKGRRFVRKYALKRLAVRMGVPEYLAVRVKKAAQYGSGTNKALERIARMRGYKGKASSLGRADYLKLYLEEVLAR